MTGPKAPAPGAARRAARGRTPALVGALALTLTACGSGGAATEGGGEPAGESSAGAGGEVDEQTLTVLAAASLTDVFELISADFEDANPGVTVEQSFSASSTVVQQVNEGAPADVIALAGTGSLEPLEEEHRTSETITFTTNTLELAVPPDNPAGVVGTDDLTADGIRLVVCQPEVPCGTATETLFEQLDLAPEIASFEPDVRATLGKVALGEADVGIVYRTDVASAGDGVLGVEIPLADNVVNSYPILAVSGAPLAQAFIDHVLSDAGQQHLTDAGFLAP